MEFKYPQYRLWSASLEYSSDISFIANWEEGAKEEEVVVEIYCSSLLI